MTNFLTWESCLAYLSTGLIALYLLQAVTLWLERTRTEEPWWSEFRSTFVPATGINWREVLITLVGFSLLSVVWPVLAFGMGINIFGSKASWRSKLPEANFICQPRYLRKAVTRADAEIMGTIVDPLGRAPVGPFGHLNAGWLTFLEKGSEGLALCYFEVPHKPVDGEDPDVISYSKYRGLAWVKGRKVRAEFVFEGC